MKKSKLLKNPREKKTILLIFLNFYVSFMVPFHVTAVSFPRKLILSEGSSRGSEVRV